MSTQSRGDAQLLEVEFASPRKLIVASCTILGVAERFLTLLQTRKSVDQIPPHRPSSNNSEYSPQVFPDYFC